MDSAPADRPVIVVLWAGPAQRLLRAVCAGIEEEGVPHTTQRHDGAHDAGELARRAARRSPLGVGVGVDARGGVCVQHDTLAVAPAELTAAPAAGDAVARTLGHNAARIVVGVPLKEVSGHRPADPAGPER